MGLRIYLKRAVLYEFQGQTGHDCRTLPVSMPNFNDQNDKILGRFLKFSTLSESSIQHK